MHFCSVYKWINAHFDQVDKIFTRGASAITSFASQDSEILIILQNSEAAHQQVKFSSKYTHQIN